jgi:glucose-1-phosphate adenylyltransferase
VVPVDSPEYGHDRATVVDSIISGGCVISGGTVRRSVLSPNVKVEDGGVVENSVLLDGACIGKGAKVRKVILDHNVFVPDGVSIGYEREQDKSRFTMSPNGVVIVPRGMSLL